jgi:hypothetical protein
VERLLFTPNISEKAFTALVARTLQEGECDFYIIELKCIFVFSCIKQFKIFAIFTDFYLLFHEKCWIVREIVAEGGP